MKQNKIKITENELKQIVAESVKKILSEARKPSDKTVGKHTLKGLRYDKNGNPLYTGELDENRVGNFIRSVFGGAKDAVGDDIDNAKDKVKGAWQDTKDAAGRVWQNTKDTAGQAWQNTKDAAENVAKGVQKRATVFKNSYNANQAYLKIMDIRKDIDDVLNSGLITGEQSVAALKNAKRCLQNLAASRKGVNSQKNKRIMNSNEEE